MPDQKRRTRRGYRPPIRLSDEAYLVVMELTKRTREQTGYKELSMCAVASNILVQQGAAMGVRIDPSQQQVLEGGD